MRRNDSLSIIFASVKEDNIHKLTARRMVASVPFGGRYRLIDFHLSNLVNAGVNKVGVITKENYQSLMDHLGSGKAWNLSRKREGLYLLPPFGVLQPHADGKIEALASVRRFLTTSHEKYVILIDGNTVLNMDFAAAVRAHEQRGADITVVYMNAVPPEQIKSTLLTLDENENVTGVRVKTGVQEQTPYSTGIYIVGREKLMELVEDCMSSNLYDFDVDLLQRNVRALQICGYRFDGPVMTISTMQSYFEANMASMLPEMREALFRADRPIYTKLRDNMPSKYGLGSHVRDSVVADGCMVEGDIEHCVLFRGVKVGKGAVLKNCVIMQDCVIGANAELHYVMTDKNVTISDGTRMMGAASYPVFIDKGSIV